VPPAARVLASLDEARDVEAVVNLAGEPLMAGRWNAERKAAFRASRLDTTRALIGWMARLSVRPRVLVSGSAIGYYGPRDDEPLDESAAPGDDFAAHLCRDWETEAMQAEGADVEWAARAPSISDLSGNAHGVGRELFGLMRANVGTAEEGACSLFTDDTLHAHR